MEHLAPLYWNKPETADCTIIIPVHRCPSLPSQRSPVPRPALPDPSARPKLPDVDSSTCITLRLHTEYLSAKSLFLRGLFSGVSPLDLIQNLCASRLQPPSAPLRVPRSKLPRLLPSPPSHPVVFLPVPDSSSIQPLFHWMYFGNTDHIESALDHGVIQWDGLVRNVEYLGLSTDIKVFLGRWYRNWFLPARCPPDCTPCPTDEGDESDVDSECDGSDYDDYYSPSTPPTDDEIQNDDGCDRRAHAGCQTVSSIVWTITAM
ncbi:hypothetical protein J3R83DRAFT_2199 [Lanmaoa asiatica]|nr:hypothetical protein J3R83DRAFT_2199 [Lanmaoa asiatica]